MHSPGFAVRLRESRPSLRAEWFADARWDVRDFRRRCHIGGRLHSRSSHCLALLFPSLADRLTRPLVALGARLSSSSGGAREQESSSILPSFLLGIATGLLWAPCAGPILGLVFTGAVRIEYGGCHGE